MFSYQRVKAPAWSPVGQLIAFVGTATYPGNQNDPKTWGQIEDLFLYPWDLYLMNADGSDVRIILKTIDTGPLTWLPQRNSLAFYGEFAKEEGIWLVDIPTQQVARLWPYRAAYDFSPNGSQIVIVERNEADETQPPVIVDFPSDLFETTK